VRPALGCYLGRNFFLNSSWACSSAST
jgi:hypothetical protein